MTTSPALQSVEDVLSSAGVNPETGLTSAEAAARPAGLLSLLPHVLGLRRHGAQGARSAQGPAAGPVASAAMQPVDPRWS